MSNKPIRTKVNPQMLIKETLHRTKKFFHKTFINLKSYFNQNLPKKPTFNAIISSSNKIDFYEDSTDVIKMKEEQFSPKVQTKGDEQRSKSSISVADCSGLEDLKEEKKGSENLGRKMKESSFLAAEALAQKMKELEMMDVNDMDHVLDIEEVLHYYSRLTCPAYQEIIDKFFIDMYSEFNIREPLKSVNSSMRKLDSASVHSSMRSLGPVKL
ncbi:hypothetical protein CDL12_21550 [Handroanthus impetiginosus]|uniref:OVATE domain-containing protein n=1 Tax=Handroanthus impetiginosus TaxID=429701 RepID=A0A2G9GKS3_9LAMI|nr:hypothetical protein CDL12_21550 [Handroanthus impetiginosus]